MLNSRAVAPLMLVVWLFSSAGRAQEKPRYAGPTEGGFLLPNGWTISPAGEQIPLTDLPLNISCTADGSFALVGTCGYNAHVLSLVDLRTKAIAAEESVRQSWFGLALDGAGQRVWWSGGGSGVHHVFRLADRSLQRISPAEPTVDKKNASRFNTGLLWDANRKRLYSCSVPAQGDNVSLAWGDASERKKLDHDTGWLTASDPSGTAAEQTISVGLRLYDVALARNGLLYASDWADRAVWVIDPEPFRVTGRIAVGEHPNQLAVHPRDDRLFVACASSNCVSVIDAKRGIVTETIYTPLFPRSPEGSTPDALVVAPDGNTLYVANADNNCVAVVDISARDRSQVKGFIPTGWYPTSLAITPDGKTLLVGVGKGNQTKSNAPAKQANEEPLPAGKRRPFPHVGSTLSGALSLVPVPDDAGLAAYTETVYRNCPYSDKLLTDAPYPTKTAIPTKVGAPSPITHVIYIIKENRTYDQVFSDIPRGNRDESLLMFGEQVTPNHHKLANEFVLLDNLYCNGHVSADGHPWSTMAYNTDFIARNWALTYSKRVGIDDDDDADLANAPSGYLWDACARHGLTYRSYGEYGGRVSTGEGKVEMEGRVPGLIGHVSPNYGLTHKPGQPTRDTDNVAVFLSEFREFEKSGKLPNLIIMSLGEDHTTGTKPGTFTPQACVASNDLALGQLVDAVSHSKFWPHLAIFVIEDDAQNGPDHVDAHRTIGLVISPYVKRKSLDSTQYSTVSMLRTMELLLGLPPLSQYDAAANPMFASFAAEPDLTPYAHAPARIDLNVKNDALAYGAERSSRMDFSEYDRIDDFELNEILWRSIKGPDAPLPPAARRAIAYRGSTDRP